MEIVPLIVGESDSLKEDITHLQFLEKKGKRKKKGKRRKKKRRKRKEKKKKKSKKKKKLEKKEKKKRRKEKASECSVQWELTSSSFGTLSLQLQGTHDRSSKMTDIIIYRVGTHRVFASGRVYPH